MALPDNRVCFDCTQRKPIWASSTFGVFICLDCSGGQRRLGTHITFVRSCDMDEWTEEQLETMRCGGNKNARAFFRANGVRDLHIRQDTKYSSSTAKAYRAKLAKEVQAALAGGRRKETTAAPAPAAEPSFFDDFEPTVPTRTASAPQISTLEQTASPPSPAPEAVNFRAVPSPKAKPVVPLRLRKASAVGSGAALSASGLSACTSPPLSAVTCFARFACCVNP